jgi:putative ABC transport system ATP-binding protein
MADDTTPGSRQTGSMRSSSAAAPFAAPPTTATAAEAIDATKIYGKGETTVRALDDVSVSFGSGQFTTIMGPSGSGKSTLLHCVAGFDRLTSGRVLIGDTDLYSLDDRALTMLRRDRVGFIFQEFNLVPTLNALENITLPLDLAGRKPDQAWMDTVLKALGLTDRLRHKPSELSGGQQQRVAVGRALITRPAIIFADEPTGNLDSQASADVLRLMRDAVVSLGQTVVMVTHDPVAAGYADRALFLADGRVEDEMIDPTAEKVLDRMKRSERQAG